MKYIVGTRGSALALAQAEYVKRELEVANPGIDIVIEKIKTKGDKILDVPLAKIGDKGLFTKEIEEKIISGDIDFAVHSMKDMPTALPTGLTIGAITKRENPRDIFISKNISFNHLNESHIIGTSSLRRKAQLMSHFPGIQIIDIRGNIETRIHKLYESDSMDGLLLATAGVQRLGLQPEYSEVVSEEIIIPAVGQGALAIEIRDDDKEMLQLVQTIHDRESALSIECERVFLKRLEGGCQVPMAAYAYIKNKVIHCTGLIASLNGYTSYHCQKEAPLEDFESLGLSIAEDLLAQGGDEILREIYGK